MKKNPFTYLKRAPKLPDARKLRPDEIAQPGDCFTFLSSWPAANPRGRLSSVQQLVGVNACGYMRIGASLETSRAEWVAEYKSSRKFDGVIYRPLKN